MVDAGLARALQEIVGTHNVSDSPSDRLMYSHDLWPRVSILRLGGKVPTLRPALVVWPNSAGQAARVLSAASEAGVPVVPFGGGSGVCGGCVQLQEGIVVDLKRMNRLVRLDEMSMAAEVEAGMIGTHLETALNERGYTLGHFPSSIMCSTVGGWVATRSAGQFSSRYGKIEDMVLGIEAALPDGSLTWIDAGAMHDGTPDFCQLFLGSEGTLGIVTRVRLRLYPAPSARRFGGFRFMDVEAGLEAMRSIMQQGLRPMVMRLYDPLDTLINNFSLSNWEDRGRERPHHGAVVELLSRLLGVQSSDLPAALTGPLLRRFLSHPGLVQHLMDLVPMSSLLVVGFEGDGQRVRENMAQASDLATRATGTELGPGPGEHWFEHRYSVSFKLTKVFNRGAFAETLEFAGLWKDVPEIYRRVRRSIMGQVSVMAHFSHAYREGCAVYFTVAGFRDDPDRMAILYDAVVRRAIREAMDAGGTVSHHHGVGLLKRSFTSSEYEGGDRLFWAIKQALDPAGVMNPQKVYDPSVPVRVSGERRVEAGASMFDEVVSWEHKTPDRSVVTPEVPDEIQEILALAASTGRRIVSIEGNRAVPAGDGAEVTFLDMSAMDEILEMDPVSGTVTAQAGIRVIQLENYLREKGFTLGFVPRSKLNLMLGDMLAVVSPGEGSPLYGTVLENCLGLSAVLADGTMFKARPVPRRSAGPDMMRCLLGAGGRYGVITAACLRVFPVPTVREALAFGADDPGLAVSVIRTILVRQARPEWVLMVIRAPGAKGSRKRVRLVFQVGGNRALVTAGLSVIRSMVESVGMEEEASRAVDRMTPRKRRFPALERHLPIQSIMEFAADLGERTDDDTCPEAHVTDFTPHVATMRLLLRSDMQEFPRGLADTLSAHGPDEVLRKAGDEIKKALDPGGILNP